MSDPEPPMPMKPAKQVPETVQVRRKARGSEPQRQAPDARREFFNDAMKEALGPLAGILERKINPWLAAIESLPAEMDRMANVTLPAVARVMDQPGLLDGSFLTRSPKNLPLPQAKPLVHLRPPGAISPDKFESSCSLCNKCVEVCPAEAIAIDRNHLIAGGLPYIVAATQPCVLCNGLECMTHCPTGALALVDKFEINMGTARVDRELCLRESGEDCRLCVEACPITGADASPEGEAISIQANTGRIVVRKNICIGCGLCESRCPTDPRAIQVIPFKARPDPMIA